MPNKSNLRIRHATCQGLEQPTSKVAAWPVTLEPLPPLSFTKRALDRPRKGPRLSVMTLALRTRKVCYLVRPSIRPELYATCCPGRLAVRTTRFSRADIVASP